MVLAVKFGLALIRSCRHCWKGKMAGKSNLELLTRDENRIEPLLNPIWNPLITGIMGGFVGLGVRYVQRRPVWSGIQLHVIAVCIGSTLGYYLNQTRNSYLAERDAVLKHYMHLHPEDFPEPERKKYSEMFNSWVPIR